MSHRDERPDRGATLVESAFALPILFMFIIALLDFGMWALNANQAANAARDGARAGVFAYARADSLSGPDRDTVVAAVRSRLPEGTADDAEIFISCVDAEGLVHPCATARVDTDRIRVEVSWTWPMFSPLAGSLGSGDGRTSGTASMVLLGLPSEAPTTTTTTTTTTIVTGA
jgi:Flp pilus assembly protein TadG